MKSLKCSDESWAISSDDSFGEVQKGCEAADLLEHPNSSKIRSDQKGETPKVTFRHSPVTFNFGGFLFQVNRRGWEEFVINCRTVVVVATLYDAFMTPLCYVNEASDMSYTVISCHTKCRTLSCSGCPLLLPLDERLRSARAVQMKAKEGPGGRRLFQTLSPGNLITGKESGLYEHSVLGNRQRTPLTEDPSTQESTPDHGRGFSRLPTYRIYVF